MSTGSVDTSGVDRDRRRFLTAGAGVVGAAGVAAAGYPFLASMQPSAKAKAEGAPVEVDIGKLSPGAKMTIEWRKRPIFIVRRTPKMLENLEEVEPYLRDPDSQDVNQQPPYAQNQSRAIKPEYLVIVGLCTHLGCSPTFRPEVGAPDLGADWKGGFFCPCHGSSFDLAGRVYSGVPATDNMLVPPYHYVSDSVIKIGEDREAA